MVFGNASDNRLIADMNTATLLPRPAMAEYVGPGRAFVGVAASAFFLRQGNVADSLAIHANAPGEG